jgi:stage III sporulation protein AD
MLRIIGVSAATVLCAILIKDKNRTIAVILSITGVCVLLFGTLSELVQIKKELSSVVSALPSGVTYIRLMLKVMLITLLTQITGDICRDNGEGALASATEIASKLVVLCLVLPLFKTVISLVSGLIK